MNQSFSRRFIPLIFALAGALPATEEPSGPVESLRVFLRYHHLAGPEALKEGELYVYVGGGFAGDVVEFVDMKEMPRSSLMVGEASKEGKFYRKQMFYPVGTRETSSKTGYNDVKLEVLRKAVAALAASKLPSEIKQEGADDAEWILVAVKTEGALRFWSRVNFNVKLEPELQQVYDRAMEAKSLVPHSAEISRKPFPGEKPDDGNKPSKE